MSDPESGSSEANEKKKNDAVTREQSSKSCLARLRNTWWKSEWRRRSVSGARSADNMEYTTFSHDSEQPIPPVNKNFKSKRGLVHLPDDGTNTRRKCVRLPDEQSSKNLRKDPKTFGRRARQRHTKTSRTRETRRNAAGRDPALSPVAGPRHRPSYHFHRRCRSPYQLN